jgi:hypothetical protein
MLRDGVEYADLGGTYFVSDACVTSASLSK